MGYHIILEVKCQVLPEYIDFIKKEYMCEDTSYDYIPNFLDDDIRSYDSDYDEKMEAKEKEKAKCELEKRMAKERKFKDINPLYEEIVEIWEQLKIGDNFYKYDLKEDIFTFRIEKKPYKHSQEAGNYRDLQDDYMRLLYEIIVPITRNIIECVIEHDDYDLPETYYKDEELRGKVQHIATCPNCNTKIYK